LRALIDALGRLGVPTSLLLATTTAAVLILGCRSEDLPPVVAEGTYVRIRHDDPDQVCAGSVGYFDAIAGEFYSRFGMQPAEDAMIDYVWTHPDGVGDHCDDGFACSRDDAKYSRSVVFADELPNVHELVHATRYRVWPRPANVLDEGLAETWGSRQPDQRWPTGVSVSDLFPDVGGGDEYVAAHHVVHGTIEEFGFEAFAALWAETTPETSVGEFEALYESRLGRSLDTVLTERANEFACVRPPCVGERLSPVEGAYSLEMPGGCDDDETVGRDPTSEAAPFRRMYVLEGHAPGRYPLQVPTSGENETVLIFEQCDSTCPGDQDEVVTDGDPMDYVDLEDAPMQVIVWTREASSESVVIGPSL
jgi:hypothetical protein